MVDVASSRDSKIRACIKWFKRRHRPPCAGLAVVGLVAWSRSSAAELESGLGQVVIDNVHPDDRLRSVTVTGLEDANGTAGNWRPVAHAICANP